VRKLDGQKENWTEGKGKKLSIDSGKTNSQREKLIQREKKPQ
jgi:hypothetical protein